MFTTAVQQLLFRFEARQAVRSFLRPESFLLRPVGLLLVNELRDAVFEVSNVIHQFVIDGRFGCSDFVLLVV